MKLNYHGEYDNVASLYCKICGDEKLAIMPYCPECQAAIDRNEKILVEVTGTKDSLKRTGHIITMAKDEFLKIFKDLPDEVYYTIQTKLFKKIFKEKKRGTDKQTKS